MCVKKFIFSKFAGLEAYSWQLYYQMNSSMSKHSPPHVLNTCGKPWVTWGHIFLYQITFSRNHAGIYSLFSNSRGSNKEGVGNLDIFFNVRGRGVIMMSSWWKHQRYAKIEGNRGGWRGLEDIFPSFKKHSICMFPNKSFVFVPLQS